MIIPSFLKDNDTIGVTACSCGVLDKIDKYEKSIKNVKKNGFNILETPDVRTGGLVSTDAKTRVNELNSLVTNKDIKMINTFSSYDTEGEIIYEGDYQCDNNNLKLQYTDEGGTKRTILAQVVEFTDTSIRFRYEEEQYNITVTFIIRKLSNESSGYYSSSSTTSLQQKS